MQCPSCGIILRADNPGPLCSVCDALVMSMRENYLYWNALEVADRDALEAQVNEKRKLLRCDEDFYDGGQR